MPTYSAETQHTIHVSVYHQILDQGSVLQSLGSLFVTPT